MKHKEVASAVVGSVFFAIPYLTLSVPLVPALTLGIFAFGASELVLPEKKQDLKETKININLSKTLEKAKKQNKHILELEKCIDNEEMKKYLLEIHESTKKIIETVEKNHKKAKNIGNFFDYYLPITIKIMERYDEIENQKLSSKDSKKFLVSTTNMLEAVNDAFKKILNNLYQSEIVDMDAEMKVFSSMLKADGFHTDELNITNDDEEDE